MIKLLNILKENKILVPRRSKEERSKNYIVAIQKQIQQYMKNGGKGDLNLAGTSITSLPPGLKVGGYLNLHHAKITSLPSGLEVEGYLDLFSVPITSLPSDLEIKGNLNLYGANITSLPSDLKVGSLNLRHTPLSQTYTEEEIRQMAPGVKGNIYM